MIREFIFLLVTIEIVLGVPTKITHDDEESMHHHYIYRRSPHLDPEPKFSVDESEKLVSYWTNNAQLSLLEQLNKQFIIKKAKNIIIFLGDGMSIPTLAAARAYKGQLEGKSGEGMALSFEEFPYTALSKTYCTDRQVADSACSATAYLCGVKANYGTIGLSPLVTRGDCKASQNASNEVFSIGRWAQLAGKATGIVTTTRVTHASPAGVYAHVAERDWESDFDLKNAEIEDCKDIARMLVEGETGRNLNVILGGGRKKFLPENHIDEEGDVGERLDNRNLIEEWLIQRQLKKNVQYVWNKKQLLGISKDTKYLLGLFESGHMNYHLDADPETEPTLAEMTEAAIKVLSKNNDGYFLFVEGGRIDQAHHGTKAQKALDETLQFSEAVDLARKQTNIEDTLIVVTSDHAHTMSLSGYANRGNDIFGIAGMSKKDDKPYATLTYANGPGFKNVLTDNGERHDISGDDMADKDYEFPATAPLSSETHGGDDVGIFASGPWAHLFSGVLEQNVIPHYMAYAACIGDGIKICDN